MKEELFSFPEIVQALGVHTHAKEERQSKESPGDNKRRSKEFGKSAFAEDISPEI